MEQLMSYISTVGFPIVMCLLFYYQMTRSDEQMNEMLTQIKVMVEEIKKAVNNGGSKV
jgi:hypothetical protein